MKIFPFEKYTIKTDRSIEEINDLIDRNCEPWIFPLFRQKNPKPLVGYRSDSCFKLYLYMEFGCRSSSKPIAFGKISMENGTTNIVITVCMHWLTITYISLVLLFLGVFSVVSLSSSKYTATSIIISIFIFVYWLVCHTFWLEEKKLKELLYNIFKNG